MEMQLGKGKEAAVEVQASSVTELLRLPKSGAAISREVIESGGKAVLFRQTVEER